MLGSLMALAVVLIGLVMIVGGPGAVGSLFAPLVGLVKSVVAFLFTILLVAIILMVLISGRKNGCRQGRGETVVFDANSAGAAVSK